MQSAIMNHTKKVPRYKVSPPKSLSNLRVQKSTNRRSLDLNSGNSELNLRSTQVAVTPEVQRPKVDLYEYQKSRKLRTKYKQLLNKNVKQRVYYEDLITQLQEELNHLKQGRNPELLKVLNSLHSEVAEISQRVEDVEKAIKQINTML